MTQSPMDKGSREHSADGPTVPATMIALPGGTFRMGSDKHYREEAPRHHVTVDAFAIDATTVTNAQFAVFIATTGYVTVAERPLDPADFPGAKPEMLKAGAMVFFQPTGPVDLRRIANWWAYVPGTSWRHPEGPGSSIAGRETHPVVQVAYEDAKAYAQWAGKDLPTEAEWEYAARGGLDGADYCWGDDPLPGGRHLANTWQGEFPWQNSGADGYTRTAPVASYPANGYGLYDMAGNVWEWTSDWYVAHHAEDADKPCCIPLNPRGAALEQSYDPHQPRIRIPRKVVKGGSFLCAPSYCLRYRPAARQPQMIDSAMSHIGFRCIVRHSVSSESASAT
ncbi:MAG: formylglycine-generating enzyme family protein [Dongiaceae bacterium]